MSATTYTDGNIRTFAIETDGQLDGKQDYLVELGTAADSVKLLATAGNEIGVVRGHSGAGAKSCGVRLLGKDGTMRVIQSGAIAKGARVVADGAALGKVKAMPGTSGTYRTLGRKITQGSGSANEVIEIIDLVETVTV
jgi:hypothetical protein